MSWVPKLHDNEPSLMFSPHPDVENQMAIYDRLYYKLFTDDDVWNTWTDWVNAQGSSGEVSAAKKFSSYALQFTCRLGESTEGTGCCFRDV